MHLYLQEYAKEIERVAHRRAEGLERRDTQHSLCKLSPMLPEEEQVSRLHQVLQKCSRVQRKEPEDTLSNGTSLQG